MSNTQSDEEKTKGQLIEELVAMRQRVAELETLETQHQRVESALRESEERSRLLVEEVKDYAIFRLDAKGRVSSWNVGAERIFGYQSAEIIGQPVSCLFTPEDEREGVSEQELRTAVDQGRAENERWHIRKDGTRFWASGIVTALRDETGNLLGFSKVARDFTERKRAEEALRESEERFRLLVEGVKDYAIFMLDTSGCVVSWNSGAECLLGYREAEIKGTPGSRLFTPEDEREGVPEQELRTAVAQGQALSERWHVRKDGTRFWSTDVVTSLRDETGNLRGFAKVMRDFTERKQLEDALRQRAEDLTKANRLKDEFLATVSHDLRTPLNAMLGWARLLRARKLNEATTARALETLERNAKSQAQLVDDLLDVSRIISGKLRLIVRPVELAPVVEAAIDTVRLAASAKDIRLESVLDPLAGPVRGDSDRLQQVVWNLLSNAIKFTPEGGRVQVRLERVGSDIQIRVSDTGKGIGADFLPYVFERFRQADATTTRSHTGLGLGLAIARHLVELHGGTVQAESQGEGQGATFTVKLPSMAVFDSESSAAIATDRMLPQSEGEVPTSSFPILDGLRVLVVDDETDAREFITTVLEQCRAEVTAVASVGEAIEALKRLWPDVLVSDIGMPGEDGYALIRKVKALESEQGRRIRAAALTAYAREEDRTRALSAGFQMHVPKPVEPATLAAVVANLAGRKGLDSNCS